MTNLQQIKRLGLSDEQFCKVVALVLQSYTIGGAISTGLHTSGISIDEIANSVGYRAVIFLQSEIQSSFLKTEEIVTKMQRRGEF